MTERDTSETFLVRVGERVFHRSKIRVGHKVKDCIDDESAQVLQKLHDDGREVHAKVSPGKLIFYIGVAGALGAVSAGAIHLRKRKVH